MEVSITSQSVADQDSDNPAASATDTFTLTVKSECHDEAITTPVLSGSASVTADLWQTLSYNFTPSTSDALTCGVITYEVVFTSGEIDNSETVYTVNVNDPLNPYVEGRPTDLSWLGSSDFVIRASLGGYKTIDSQAVSLSLENPCRTTTFTETELVDMEITV